MKKLLSIAVLMLLAGCSGMSNESDSITKFPSVISSFYPIEYVVSEIEPELAQHNLLGTQNVHGFDLSTANVVLMEKAELVIGLDLELEPWLEASKDRTLFLANAGLQLLDATQDFHHEGHADEEGQHEGHAEHDHGNPTHDPHVWLSPVNMLAMADNIYGALEQKQLLTDGSAERLANLKSELQKLDAAYRTALTGCQANTAFVSHNSFAYLEDLYNFDLTSIMGLSSLDRLSLKNLRDLQNVKTNAVLIEALENQEYAETLKKDMNLNSFVVYNGSKQVDGLDYMALQYKNLESLKLALECL